MNAERFGRNWARASASALAPAALEAGAERLLLARERQLRRAQRMRRALTAAAAAAAVFVAVAALFVLLRPSPPYAFTINSKSAAAGARVAASPDAQVLRFSEGSTLTLTRESSLDVRQVTEKGATLWLERGVVQVDIVPRSGSSWVFNAGPFVVQVLGTAFQLEWAPDSEHFSIAVQRGAVQVEGPMLEQGRKVGAGTRCTVDWRSNRFALENIDAQPSSRSESESTAPPEPEEAQASSAASAPSAALHDKAARPVESARRRSPSAWRELERAGEFERAIEEAERVGVDAIYDTSDAEGLMSLARAARFVGRADLSSGALLSCRRRFAGTPSAAMAAYLLGRNAPPGDAVRWFTTYLAEQPSGAWAREASGRLIEAYRASGNPGAARDAAKRYLAQYPNGPHAEFARMALEN
ncbi:MAG: FecR domain-containing protein [Polyangiaceae bacterium]